MVHEKLQGTAQPLGNLLHCLTSHSEKVFHVFSLSVSCWIYARCLSLPPTMHHCEEPISLLHTLPMGASRLLVGLPPNFFSGQGGCTHRFPSDETCFITGEGRRVTENAAVDYFQSHKTLEIIPFLKAVKTSEVELRRPLLVLTPCV